MIIPVQNALNAFIIIYNALPLSFKAFIVTFWIIAMGFTFLATIFRHTG